MNKNSRTISIAGRDLIFETGKLARLARGSVTLSLRRHHLHGNRHASGAVPSARDRFFFP